MRITTWREKMLLFVLPLLILFPTGFGTPLHGIYSYPSPLPRPSLARRKYLEHVTTTSMIASFTPFIAAQRFHLKYLSASPAPSSELQGPVTSLRSTPLAPFPSTSTDCSQTCTLPYTSTPFGSPCMCVLPMRVRLLLGVPLYAIFPEVTELEIEVAEGTYLKQRQVKISGANADGQNPNRAVVDLHLVPLGEKFDNTTAILTYQRFVDKKVALNRTLFGDYNVIYIYYPGLPSPPPPGGDGSSGRDGKAHDPVSANIPLEHHQMKMTIVFVIAFSAIIFVVACLAATVFLLKCGKVQRPANTVGLVFASLNKRSGKELVLSSSPASSTSVSIISAFPPSVKMFSLGELNAATENFSPMKVLGEGGFGCVYHGTMPDGKEVAVKLLTRDIQNGEREFIAEVETLSRLHHRNLVKLIGICIEQHTRCLVYELVPNGSVESHLHGAAQGKGDLDWDARLKIALGTARALAYLHEDSNPRIIHRDFKASNILLEDDFTPKVSDFGLAREATEGSRHISTRVMGTFGYVAPEYAMTGHLLVKSDVYSYGVVLLELLTGRIPVDMSQPPGQENLVTWVRPLLTNKEALEQLVDPTLARTYNFDDLTKVAAIASMCVHPEVAQRPFMGEVVQALKLIYNDTEEMSEDACSPKDSFADDSDFKEHFTPSDSSWWNAGDPTPPLAHRQPAVFITMEYCSETCEEPENRMVPGEHDGCRSDPLITNQHNPAFSRPVRSMSERGKLLKHALHIGRDHGGSF